MLTDVFRRLFGRSAPPQPDVSAWWNDVDAFMASPNDDTLTSLKSGVIDEAVAPDLAESQNEMLDGLQRLLDLSRAAALPVVPTQHRVIGQSTCHFLAPASLVDQVDAGGKLFVTAERLLFSAGRVAQWPWHSITDVTRVERDLIVDVRGQPQAAHLRMNSFGDAVIVAALAERLRPNRP